MRRMLIGGAVTLMLAGGCDAAVPGPVAADPIACGTGSITGRGSSAQSSALSAWIKDYQVACAQASIAYFGTGSGAGVAAFAAGQGDFAGSDSALSDSDRAAVAARCGSDPIHLPMVAGPIALAYNVAGVDGLRLAPVTVARIFAGRITVWNDPQIGRDNPGQQLPATPIRTVHRADSSGTTDNFTRFLSSAAATDWTFGSGSAWKAPGGTAEKGSNRVARRIESTDGAIGYIEGSYATFHELPAALIRNAAGEFTALTDAAAGLMVEAARPDDAGSDLNVTIDYAARRPGAYPLVLVTYEIACRTGTPPLAKSFLAYAAGTAGQERAQRAGYAPLPESLRRRVAAAVATL